jgi:5-methylcytosine-specific restriction protein A
MPRCLGYAVRDGRCAAHQRSRTEETRHMPGNLTPWNKRFMRLRRSFLIRNPICRECRNPATVLDHITRHRGNARLFWDQSNWQPLCARCHGLKTARETLGASR